MTKRPAKNDLGAPWKNDLARLLIGYSEAPVGGKQQRQRGYDQLTTEYRCEGFNQYVRELSGQGESWKDHYSWLLFRRFMEHYKNKGGEPAFLAWHLMALSEEYGLDTQISLDGETVGEPKGKRRPHQTDVDHTFRDSVKYRHRLIRSVIKNESQSVTDYFRFDRSHVGHFVAQIAEPLLASFQEYSDPATTDYEALLDEFRFTALTDSGDNDQTQNVRIDQARSPWAHSQTENTAKEILDDLNATSDLLPEHITTRDLGGFLTLTPVQVISELSDPQRRLLLGDPTEDGDPAEAVLKEAHRAVVLGDPGSGKTTILKLLAINELMESRRTTIFLELHRLASRLREIHEEAPVRYHPDAINEILFSNISITIPAFPPARRNDVQTTPLRQLAILDGLDEVPPGSRQLVTEFIERIPESWDVVVGSRAVDYQPLRGNWAELTVDVLAPEPQGRFLDLWFRNNLESESSVIARQTLRDIDVPRLPIFTTLIAKVARPGNEPSNAYDLYDRYVEQFLQQVWRESSKVDSQTTMMELWDVAETIAWRMWNSGMKSGGSSLGVPTSYKKLTGWLEKTSYQTLEQLVRKTGLLVPTSELDTPLLQEYRWIHQSFGEFLAGRYLGKQIESGNWRRFLELCQSREAASEPMRFCLLSLPHQRQESVINKVHKVADEDDPNDYLRQAAMRFSEWVSGEVRFATANWPPRPSRKPGALFPQPTGSAPYDADSGSSGFPVGDAFLLPEPSLEPTAAKREGLDQPPADTSSRHAYDGDDCPQDNVNWLYLIENTRSLFNGAPKEARRLVELLRLKSICDFSDEDKGLIQELVSKSRDAELRFTLVNLLAETAQVKLFDQSADQIVREDAAAFWRLLYQHPNTAKWPETTGVKLCDSILTDALAGRLGNRAAYKAGYWVATRWSTGYDDFGGTIPPIQSFAARAKTGFCTLLETEDVNREIPRLFGTVRDLKSAREIISNTPTMGDIDEEMSLKLLEALVLVDLESGRASVSALLWIIAMCLSEPTNSFQRLELDQDNIGDFIMSVAKSIIDRTPYREVISSLPRVEWNSWGTGSSSLFLKVLGRYDQALPSLETFKKLSDWAVSHEQISISWMFRYCELSQEDEEVISWIIDESEILNNELAFELFVDMLYRSGWLAKYRRPLILMLDRFRIPHHPTPTSSAAASLTATQIIYGVSIGEL